MPPLNDPCRRGNALFLATIILALVATGMMAVTDNLMGRQKLEVMSRHSTRAQDAAESVAGMMADRIRANSSFLLTDFTPGTGGANPLGNWLTRGYIGNVADVSTVKGLWLNNCLVYWRMEPVACYDRTITDANHNGVLDDADVTTLAGSNYIVNQSYDIGAALPPRGVGTGSTNPGLLLFELTVDAYAMDSKNRLDASPVAVAARIAGARKEDQSPLHGQTKKRVMVQSLSLFRYVIFYNASGSSGDLELYQAPDIAVVGAVHTNGAAYLNTNVGVGVFGSSPAVADTSPLDPWPALKPISFTAVNGIFCMRKLDNYQAGLLNPMTVSRSHAVNASAASQAGNYTYLNSVQLQYSTRTVGGYTLQKPVVLGALANPLTVARDSRQSTGGSPLSGYDSHMVRDGPNRQLKVVDIASRLKMSGYRPLEPFALIPPNTMLRGANGTWSVVTGTPTASTRATDMLLFQRSSTTQDILPTQDAYAGDTPSPAITALSLPTPNAALVSAFNTTTTLLPGAALVPPVVCRTAACTIDPNDIFSNLANYIQPTVPANAPVLNSYIRNPLGLNAVSTPGVGIVILERGKQAVITSWPSGRLGSVSWDPPSIYSTNDVNTGLGSKYYDADANGTIDAAMMAKYLMDYCQWMRSNYAVYFGVDSTGRLVDITDQFFSVPAGAASINDLLAHEDVFKDRREGRWRQSTTNQYTASGAANYDDLRVNALTLNMGAICTFIKSSSPVTTSSMTLNRLDPSTGSAAVASTRFNGTIYAARTPRYSNPGVPGAAGKGLIGIKSTDAAKMQTYRVYGEFHPLAPMGFSPLMSGLNLHYQRTTLPAVAADTIPTGATLRYPVVGDATQATVNGYTGNPLVVFGSGPQVWSNYPLLKRVRITNAGTINWGGARADGRAIGLTIYTPDVCYLQGNFNVVADGTGKYPVCALYCDGLIALSNNWSDAAVNALTGSGGPQTGGSAVYTTATSTVYRLCLVMHNTPTDLANVSSTDVWQPGGSGGIHNVIKFLENWSGIDWAFVGSLVVLDRARYTRGYLGNQDIYEPPARLYCFNDDLFRELPPFPDVVSDVFVW